MNISEIEKFIKEKVSKDEYKIKLHSLQRINERGVMPDEIKDVLLNCKIIENYPDDKRGHSCLVSGKTCNERNLHIVCGIASNTLWIITIYEPSEREWKTPEQSGAVICQGVKRKKYPLMKNNY